MTNTLQSITSTCSFTLTTEDVDGVPCQFSTDQTVKTEVSSMLSADLRDTVAFDLGYSIPEVQAVFVLSQDKTLYVWSVVPERDHSVYRKIYAKEKDIIEQFDGVDFEFNIVSSRGRDPRTLISASEAQLAFTRK